MDLKQQIGAAIRAKRTELGMSQEDLGLRIGLDQGYVSRIEQGKRNLTLDTLEEICKVMGVKAAELF